MDLLTLRQTSMQNSTARAQGIPESLRHKVMDRILVEKRANGLFFNGGKGKVF